jgi:hypothetical protein
MDTTGQALFGPGKGMFKRFDAGVFCVKIRLDILGVRPVAWHGVYLIPSIAITGT